ncbi:hypothetical protein, partial [Mesorhizobium sp. M0520]|uniref:hypothetical protein n=1 Tax=unclassified Mesorhizobium TaxID=325217 RepID=UPI00333AE35C
MAYPFIVPQIQHKADPRRSSPRKRSRRDRLRERSVALRIGFHPATLAGLLDTGDRDASVDAIGCELDRLTRFDLV